MLAICLAVIESPESKSLFEKLYLEYRQLVYRKAYSYLHNVHDAEDATADTFLRVANNFEDILDKFLPKENRENLKRFKESCPKIGAFLVIIVRNICIDKMRSAHKREMLTDDEAIMDALSDIRAQRYSTENEHLSNELINHILEAISDLGDTLRDVMHLHIVFEYSVSEISNILECSKDAVYKRVQRGREELRKRLEENE